DELSAQRAAAAIFDHISCSLNSGRFAHDAKVERSAAAFQVLAYFDRAIHSRTFFIAGQKEGDRNRGIRMRPQELFACNDHGCNRSLDGGGGAAIEFAIANYGSEWFTRPLTQRAGWYHVGVPGEYKRAGAGCVAAPDRPHVVDTKTLRSAVHALTGKTKRC